MSTSSRKSGHYVCVICKDQVEIPRTGVPRIANDHVCPPCIKDLFEHSIAHETNYPPRWGQRTLNPWLYRDILGEDFLQSFRAIAEEYGCPGTERVYCRNQVACRAGPSSSTNTEECGNFLGRVRETQRHPQCPKCGQCNAATCLRCRRTFPPLLGHDAERVASSSSNEMRVDHQCCPENAQAVRDEAFKGLRRGRHYQDCPLCRRRVELRDGCNHITCPCGESYCYICGRSVTEISNHWDRSRGRCPRYGQPGSRAAIFSDDVRGLDEQRLYDLAGPNDRDTGSESSSLSAPSSDDDSLYVPSEHGDLLLSEDQARLEIQMLLEGQARREQRREDGATQRAEHGRAHVRELARQRNMAAAERDVSEDDRSRRQIHIELGQWTANREARNAVSEGTRDFARNHPNFRYPRGSNSDANGHTAPGAQSRPALTRTTTGPSAQRQNRFALPLHEIEDRNHWLIVDELDGARARGRIMHPLTAFHNRRRSGSIPDDLPRGTRFQEYNRLMYARTANERPGAVGDGGSPRASQETNRQTYARTANERPGAVEDAGLSRASQEQYISGRSTLHRSDAGHSQDVGQDEWLAWRYGTDALGLEDRMRTSAPPPRTFRGALNAHRHAGGTSDQDWNHDVDPSRQFAQQRRDHDRLIGRSMRSHSTETLGDMIVAAREGHQARMRRATGPDDRDVQSEEAGRPPHMVPDNGHDQGRSRRRAVEASRPQNAEVEGRRRLRSLPRRVWRYSQRVGGAILNSPP